MVWCGVGGGVVWCGVVWCGMVFVVVLVVVLVALCLSVVFSWCHCFNYWCCSVEKKRQINERVG